MCNDFSVNRTYADKTTGTLVLLSVAPLITQIRLFTVFAFEAVEKAGVLSIFLALLGQLTLLTLCSVQITRQLKKAGESNSIGLFALPKTSLP